MSLNGVHPRASQLANPPDRHWQTCQVFLLCLFISFWKHCTPGRAWACSCEGLRRGEQAQGLLAVCMCVCARARASVKLQDTTGSLQWASSLCHSSESPVLSERQPGPNNSPSFWGACHEIHLSSFRDLITSFLLLERTLLWGSFRKFAGKKKKESNEKFTWG